MFPFLVLTTGPLSTQVAAITTSPRNHVVAVDQSLAVLPPSDDITDQIIDSGNVFDTGASPDINLPSEEWTGLYSAESNGKVPKVLTKNLAFSLRDNIAFWKSIGTSSYVLDVIQNGLLLPFNSMPAPKYMSNHPSPQEHSEFVQETIDSLMSRGGPSGGPFQI